MVSSGFTGPQVLTHTAFTRANGATAPVLLLSETWREPRLEMVGECANKVNSRLSRPSC